MTDTDPEPFSTGRWSTIRRWIALAVVPALLLITGCPEQTAKKPSAARGIIDLSSWDYSSRGPAALDGEWEFYWGRFINPDDLAHNKTQSDADYIMMPGFWNGRTVSGAILPGHGLATMRLVARLGSRDGTLVMKIPHMYTAYTLWINGCEVSSNGKTATDAAHATPRFLPKTVVVRSEAETLDLVLQVSNFHHPKGGMWSSIEIGTESQVIDAQRLFDAFIFFVLGGILITAVYHIGIFLFRRSDRAALFFGLLCLIMALRISFEGDRLMLVLFPWICWEATEKISYLTFYSSVFVVNLYIYHLFSDIYSRTLVRVCVAIGSVFCIAVLVLKSQTYFYTRYPYYINLAFWMLYDIYIFIRAALAKKEGAIYLISGMIILTVTVVIDVLYNDRVIDFGNASGIGLLIFAVSQAMFLSDRSSKAFTRIEILSSEKAHLFAGSIDVISSILLASSTRLYEFTRNVTRISVMLARRLGISPDGIEDIRIAALLHDIGLMGLPEAIAGRDARISPDEILIMENHPQKSIEIIDNLKGLAGVKLIIAQHHERHDGSGYPLGLAGTEITLGARIIGLIDDFVTMLGRREFQTEDKKSVIIGELLQHKGTLYDPELVDILIDLIKKENLVYVINENDIRHEKKDDADEWIFPSDVNYEISVVKKIIAEIRSRVQIGSKESRLIESGLGEVIRNAIIHGNKYDESKHVTVKFGVRQAEEKTILEFKISDQGSGMDLARYHQFRDSRFKLYNIAHEIKQYIPTLKSPKVRDVLGNLNQKLQAFFLDYYINYNKFRHIDSAEASGGVGLILVMQAFDNVDFRNIVENNSMQGMEVILEKYISRD